MYEKLYHSLNKDVSISIKDDYSSFKTRFKQVAKYGLLKHAIPKNQEGHGDKFLDLVKVHYNLGYETRDSDLLLSLAAHLWGAIFPILLFGTKIQKNKYLSGLLNGFIIGGHAITEPLAGSDINNISTIAIPVNNGYMINGIKRYITNSPIAELIIVYAKTNDNISAFIVCSDDQGVQFLKNHETNGFGNTPIGEILLVNCLVTSDRLLGKLGAGMQVMQRALELERAFIFSGIAGIMQWQIKEVISYSKKRLINNQAIRNNIIISHKIADMAFALENIILWLEKCANLQDNNKSISLASSYTKLYSSEAFLKSTLNTIQILGAYGIEKDKIFSRLVLDALATRLLSGSNEIQKNIISGLIGSYKSNVWK